MGHGKAIIVCDGLGWTIVAAQEKRMYLKSTPTVGVLSASTREESKVIYTLRMFQHSGMDLGPRFSRSYAFLWKRAGPHVGHQYVDRPLGSSVRPPQNLMNSKAGSAEEWGSSRSAARTATPSSPLYRLSGRKAKASESSPGSISR